MFDGYDLKRYARNKRENLILKQPKNNLPNIGSEFPYQGENRCMTRERGFNYEAQGEEDLEEKRK